ncbi:MAG: DNA polymerase III subunit delta [Bacteroidales bacterium]|nr:DNA polymerase III subunit delta [Bacteroidales bacterium]
MGEEPYYPDLVCNAIMDNCLQDWEKDFNETICYGADVDADAVATAAMRYPMMADRQLVVVREAQAMKDIEALEPYCSRPLESTVLVLCLHGASLDKRKALYKTILKKGVVVESLALRDYEVPRWIPEYYAGRGLQIEPEAAALLAEFAGTDLSRIAVETDKMVKNLPEGATLVTVKDVETNVGISREFSIFELTRQLSFRNAPAALRTAAFIGQGAKFALPMATSALFTHFNRILRYEAILQKNPNPPQDLKVKALGVSPFFFKEYDAAVRNYPLPKCMTAISLLTEYDFKGKGGDAGEATPAELLIELTTKLLNI